MRLKYYLRGLGIGIAVTAVIMGVSAKKNAGAMTDAQIIARARELGMVDGVLTGVADPEREKEETDGGDIPEGNLDLPEPEKGVTDAGAEAFPDGGVSPDDNEISAEGVHAPDTDNEEAGQENSSTIIVAIYPGEGSYTVSRKLAALGLVESADIYDGFLCQNGYDKKLCTGNYEIHEGATAEEIARIITKNQ